LKAKLNENSFVFVLMLLCDTHRGDVYKIMTLQKISAQVFLGAEYDKFELQFASGNKNM